MSRLTGTIEFQKFILLVPWCTEIKKEKMLDSYSEKT